MLENGYFCSALKLILLVTFFIKEAIQRWIEISTWNKIRMKLQVMVAGKYLFSSLLGLELELIGGSN